MIPRLTPADLLRLQVDALVRLNRVGALMGEQVSISPTSNGLLQIDAFVDTASRKAELTRALAPLTPRWAVRAKIQTFAEAQQRQPAAPDGPPVIRSVEITDTRAAAYEDVKRFLLDRGAQERPADAASGVAADAGPEIERKIQQLTGRVLEHSLQARLHARALAQIVSRVSANDVQALGPERVENWQALIREHADRFRRETEALKTELQPIFFSTLPEELAAGELDSRSVDVWQAAARLFALASAHDATVGQAFTLSVKDATPVRVRSIDFWRSLLAADALAANLQNAAAAIPRQ